MVLDLYRVLCNMHGHGKQTKSGSLILKLVFYKYNIHPTFQGITLTPDNRAVIQTRVEIEMEKLSGLGME